MSQPIPRPSLRLAAYSNIVAGLVLIVALILAGDALPIQPTHGILACGLLSVLGASFLLYDMHPTPQINAVVGAATIAFAGFAPIFFGTQQLIAGVKPTSFIIAAITFPLAACDYYIYKRARSAFKRYQAQERALAAARAASEVPRHVRVVSFCADNGRCVLVAYGPSDTTYESYRPIRTPRIFSASAQDAALGEGLLSSFRDSKDAPAAGSLNDDGTVSVHWTAELDAFWIAAGYADHAAFVADFPFECTISYTDTEEAEVRAICYRWKDNTRSSRARIDAGPLADISKRLGTAEEMSAEQLGAWLRNFSQSEAHGA